MKQQKLITGTNFSAWNEKVNDYLEQGWNVVPGTIVISTTSNSGSSYVTTYFAIVIERE